MLELLLALINVPSSLLYLKKKYVKDRWIPLIEEIYPCDDDYILLSFSNYSVPLVGRYRTDEEGGAFYLGDESDTCSSMDMIVNAWMPLPKQYDEI